MTKMYRGFVIVDRPIHTNGLDQVIDFTRSGLTDYLIVQIPAGINNRQAITRWVSRNAPTSRYLKVTGHWGRDTWLIACPDAKTLREFRAFLHLKRPHHVVWSGSNATTFVEESSRVLEVARIDGRVDGPRGVNHGR